jgi:hypothetical protein
MVCIATDPPSQVQCSTLAVGDKPNNLKSQNHQGHHGRLKHLLVAILTVPLVHYSCCCQATASQAVMGCSLLLLQIFNRNEEAGRLTAAHCLN